MNDYETRKIETFNLMSNGNFKTQKEAIDNLGVNPQTGKNMSQAAFSETMSKFIISGKNVRVINIC